MVSSFYVVHDRFFFLQGHSFSTVFSLSWTIEELFQNCDWFFIYSWILHEHIHLEDSSFLKVLEHKQWTIHVQFMNISWMAWNVHDFMNFISQGFGPVVLEKMFTDDNVRKPIAKGPLSDSCELKTDTVYLFEIWHVLSKIRFWIENRRLGMLFKDRWLDKHKVNCQKHLTLICCDHNFICRRFN